MPYPYPNSYPNPYTQNLYGQTYGQFQQPQQTYAFVNGIEGAKSYPLSPNQTVMLMDSEQPVCYMKQSNGMGQATLKYFRLVETSEQELRSKAEAPRPEYATKAEFDALSKKVAELIGKKGE